MAVQHIVDGTMVFLRHVDFQLIAGRKGFRHVCQRDAILRTFWPGEACLNAAHIKLKRTGKYRFIARIAPHTLRFGIGLYQRHLLFAASAQTHVLQRDVINWEKATGCAIFWCHVGNGRAVSQGQRIQPVPVELNKFAHHPMLAQHLRNGKYQIGRGNAF